MFSSPNEEKYMFKKFHLYTFILISLIIPVESFGKDSWNLSRLINVAMEQSAEVRAAEESLKAAEASTSSQYANFMPAISSKVANSYEPQEIMTQDASSSSAVLTSSMNLFRGFADKSSLEIEKLNEDIARLNLTKIKAQVSNEVYQAFYDFLYYKELIQLSESIVSRRKDNQDMILLLYEGGREEKGAYLQAKAKYLGSKLDLTQAQRQFKTALENLQTKVGIVNLDPSKISGVLNADLTIPELTDFKDLASKSQDLKMAKLDLEIAGQQIVAADAQNYPSLDLAYSLGKSGESLGHLDNDYQAVTLSLTIPIFEAGKNYYNSKKAFYTQQEKQYSLDSQSREKSLSIELAFNELMNQKESVELQKAFISASKIRAEVSTNQYQNGLTTFTSWDLIQNEYIANEKSFLLSQRSLHTSYSELNKILGVINRG